MYMKTIFVATTSHFLEDYPILTSYMHRLDKLITSTVNAVNKS